MPAGSGLFAALHEKNRVAPGIQDDLLDGADIQAGDVTVPDPGFIGEMPEMGPAGIIGKRAQDFHGGPDHVENTKIVLEVFQNLAADDRIVIHFAIGGSVVQVAEDEFIPEGLPRGPLGQGDGFTGEIDPPQVLITPPEKEDGQLTRSAPQFQNAIPVFLKPGDQRLPDRKIDALLGRLEILLAIPSSLVPPVIIAGVAFLS
jgi:hypothetical protein